MTKKVIRVELLIEDRDFINNHDLKISSLATRLIKEYNVGVLLIDNPMIAATVVSIDTDVAIGITQPLLNRIMRAGIERMRNL